MAHRNLDVRYDRHDRHDRHEQMAIRVNSFFRQDRAHVNAAIFSMCLSPQGGLFTVGGYNTSLASAATWQQDELRGRMSSNIFTPCSSGNMDSHEGSAFLQQLG